MSTLQFFKTEKISEHLICVTGITGELMFLAEGRERAVLIDTGIGLGDLGALVKSLTQKPPAVILTHGHLDHAGNLASFEDVFLNPADLPIYKAHQDAALREGYVKMMTGSQFALIRDADYAGPFKGRFKALQPGDIFDLGGLFLEILPGAGHTPGSITILFREERTLLLGDACNFFTFLWDENSSSVTEYRKMLLGLRDKTAGRFDRTLVSHGAPVAPAGMIDSVIAVCDDILAGRTDDIPFMFMGKPNPHAFIAKAMTFADRAPHRVDGGLGNVVYNKNKLI